MAGGGGSTVRLAASATSGVAMLGSAGSDSARRSSPGALPRRVTDSAVRIAWLRSPGKYTGSTASRPSDHAASAAPSVAERSRGAVAAMPSGGPSTSSAAEALIAHGAA